MTDQTIPPGPWATFGGPPPDPPMEFRITGHAPPHWPRDWTLVADVRSLRNLIEMRDDGRNFHGVELRIAEPHDDTADAPDAVRFARTRQHIPAYDPEE